MEDNLQGKVSEVGSEGERQKAVSDTRGKTHLPNCINFCCYCGDDYLSFERLSRWIRSGVAHQVGFRKFSRRNEEEKCCFGNCVVNNLKKKKKKN